MAAPTPPRPMTVTVDIRTAEILRRCYRGQTPQSGLRQALILKAEADGRMKAGKIIIERDAKRGRA